MRARIKALLDKTSIGSKTSPDRGEEPAPSSFVPSPSQLAAIESDAFEAASFVSHRAGNKVRLWSLISV